MKLVVERLAHAAGLDGPAYETAGAAGLDLRAAVEEDLTLAPGERVLVPTGLVLELPPGHEAQVRPRSGLAVRDGVTVLNAPGTVDEDYRGEVMVPLINLGGRAFTVRRGMRVAQMVIAPVTRVTVEEGPVERNTERGSGGFGSTGR